MKIDTFLLNNHNKNKIAKSQYFLKYRDIKVNNN